MSKTPCFLLHKDLISLATTRADLECALKGDNFNTLTATTFCVKSEHFIFSNTCMSGSPPCVIYVTSSLEHHLCFAAAQITSINIPSYRPTSRILYSLISSCLQTRLSYHQSDSVPSSQQAEVIPLKTSSGKTLCHQIIRFSVVIKHGS